MKLTRNLTRSRVKPQPKIYALLPTRDNLPFCLLGKCDLALRKSQGKLRRSPQLVSLWRTLGSNDRQKVRHSVLSVIFSSAASYILLYFLSFKTTNKNDIILMLKIKKAKENNYDFWRTSRFLVGKQASIHR